MGSVRSYPWYISSSLTKLQVILLTYSSVQISMHLVRKISFDDCATCVWTLEISMHRSVYPSKQTRSASDGTQSPALGSRWLLDTENNHVTPRYSRHTGLRHSVLNEFDESFSNSGSLESRAQLSSHRYSEPLGAVSCQYRDLGATEIESRSGWASNLRDNQKVIAGLGLSTPSSSIPRFSVEDTECRSPFLSRTQAI